ncbi:MAG: AAA family ATPase [Chloroflexi bacterium]|nr:AAA family ATPase [Chloroflexota bacterium]
MTNEPIDHSSDVSDETGAVADGPVPLPPGSVVADDLRRLLDLLPDRIRERLLEDPEIGSFLEVILDLGRLPEARFVGREVILSDDEVTAGDIEAVVTRIGAFGDDNRAGIPRTLHRISAIRNRRGDIVGLTCRAGRAVMGTVDVIRDLVESGRSILILGRPGVGKTTILRETARVLADDLRKRVVIVDTSNEIAGDGDIPHPGIGRARRMQVPTPSQQHAIQTVTLGDDEARRRGTQKTILERKAPPTFDVLVEMQDRQRLIVHRDVTETVDGLLRGQPVLIEARSRREDGTIERRAEVTTRGAGDDRRRGPAPEGFGAYGGPSPRPDSGRGGWRERGGSGWRDRGASRYGSPERYRWRDPVDGVEPGYPAAAPVGRAMPAEGMAPVAGPAGLADAPDDRWSVRIGGRVVPGPFDPADPAPVRERTEAIATDDDTDDDAEEVDGTAGEGSIDIGGRLAMPQTRRTVRVFPFGVNRGKLETAIAILRVPVIITKELREAEVVLTVKNYYRTNPGPVRDAEGQGVPVFVIKSNAAAHIQQSLEAMYSLQTADPPRDLEDLVLAETKDAVDRVKLTTRPVELPPQNAYIRRLQHQLASDYGVGSRSTGREPHRRVTLFRVGPGGR